MKILVNKVFRGGLLSLSFATLFFFSGCLKSAEDLQTPEEYLVQLLASVNKTQLAAELAVIDDSLDVWDLSQDILIEPNGVRYKIDTLGPADGIKPKLNNLIKIEYTGKLLSTGETFDTSKNLSDKFLESYLYALIPGIQTTLPFISEGTFVTLYIPSVYAYGSTDLKDANDNIVIPKNSNLIFEIKLLDVR